MRGLQDANPSDLRLVEPPPPVQAGSWADALRRQVATLQSACNEYREEIHRLRGLLGEAKAEVSSLRADLRAERGGPVGGIEVRMMGPKPGGEFLSLQTCISELMLLQGGPEAIRHLCRAAEHRLVREYERRGVANP